MATKPAKTKQPKVDTVDPTLDNIPPTVTTEVAKTPVFADPNARSYGWKPDVADHRDYMFNPPMAKALPLRVGPLGAGGKIENQGPLGSCTGNATTSMLETVLRKRNVDQPDLSRLMAYYNGRVLGGTVDFDSGARIRDVIKGLLKHGVARETLCPYVIDHFRDEPTDEAQSDGVTLSYVIRKLGLNYYRITSLGGVLAALAEGHPVTFGFAVPASFETLSGDFVLKTPCRTEAILGGHAVLAVGYDLVSQTVLVRNSYGDEWGLNGYFKMPFDWFNSPQRLVDDMWVLR